VLMASRKPLPCNSIPPMPSAWTCGESVGFSLWSWAGPHSGKTDSSAGLESGGVTGTRHGPSSHWLPISHRKVKVVYQNARSVGVGWVVIPEERDVVPRGGGRGASGMRVRR
jgi:hypothetical protein